MDEFNKNDSQEIFSKKIRAGKRTYFFDIQIPFNCDMVIQKLEDDIWLIECFIPETQGSRNVNSRMWVCDTIEGVEECLKENF
jgi:hypothetical protein